MEVLEMEGRMKMEEIFFFNEIKELEVKAVP